MCGLAVTGVIVPGCGTAMARAPRMLPPGRVLTAVTSSLPIAPACPARPGLQVLAADRRPRSRTLAAAGGRAGNARAGAAVPGAGDFARSGERDEPGTLRAGAGAGVGDGLVPEPGSGGLPVAQA